jgi:hypothetical protein
MGTEKDEIIILWRNPNPLFEITRKLKGKLDV